MTLCLSLFLGSGRYVRMPFGDSIFPFNYCLLKEVVPAAIKPVIGLVC